jgi:DNA-binding SARP family transcriptional activator
MAPVIGMMGPLRLNIGYGTLPTPPKARTVFALLAVCAGQMVKAETLVYELWDENPPRSYIGTLQNYVLTIRRSVPNLIKTGHKGYTLALKPDDVDALLYIDRVAQVQKMFLEGRFSEAQTALLAAQSLNSGQMLVDVDCGRELSLWVTKVADYQHTARMCYFELALRAGRHPEVLNDLRDEWRSNPGREDLAKLLMFALSGSMLRLEAIEVFHKTQASLRADYGVDACLELRELFRKILQGEEIDL